METGVSKRGVHSRRGMMELNFRRNSQARVALIGRKWVI